MAEANGHWKEIADLRATDASLNAKIERSEETQRDHERRIRFIERSIFFAAGSLWLGERLAHLFGLTK